MSEVSGPIIATVLVLASVFIPAAFMAGTTGMLYKQFAITIAISVTISGFVALTLTPALCASWLSHSEPKTKGFFYQFNRLFGILTVKYGGWTRALFRRTLLVVVLFGAMMGQHFLDLPSAADRLCAQRRPGLCGCGHHASAVRESAENLDDDGDRG